MPRQPINYKKAVIYHIVSKNPDLNDWKHIDFTTDFCKRKHYIKTCCYKGKDEPLFNFINANGGWDNFKMLAVKEFPSSSAELVKTEMFHMGQADLNAPSFV